jgi:hypothetical protein
LRRSARPVGLAALALLVVGAAGATRSAQSPEVGGCPVFPASNVWNQPVDRLPVAKDSAALIRSIGLDSSAHADFGAGLYDGQRIGIPYVLVSGRRTPEVRPRFDYADESDPGPYPIPSNVPIEGDPRPGDGDRHALIVDRDTCTLYELYGLRHTATGWAAGSGAVWKLDSNRLRPNGWTSADAAGLPIFPAVIRYDELQRGEVEHAMRFTIRRSRKSYVYPATHHAGHGAEDSLPRMGDRFRLKQNVDISGFSPTAQAILKGLKKYGMFVADNGLEWSLSMAPDPRIPDIHDELRKIRGIDFEVIEPPAGYVPATD